MLPSVLRALALLILLALPGAPALAESELEAQVEAQIEVQIEAQDGGPIVLTTDDLERLKAKVKTGDADGANLIIVPTTDRPHARSRARGHRPGHAPPDFDTPATSWQEEYYRLKSIALKRAMERGDPIYFGEPAAPASPAAEAPNAFRATAGSASRACIYARDGALVYAPPGRSCRE
jgi:hypothetical protein